VQPDSTPPRANLDLERDWFWTGVPAGFIVAVFAALGWFVAGFWVALAVTVVLVLAGVVWSGRDGKQCRAMFTVGSLILLLPGLIVEFVVIHHVLGR
jgi:hypothetical protein